MACPYCEQPECEGSCVDSLIDLDPEDLDWLNDYGPEDAILESEEKQGEKE